MDVTKEGNPPEQGALYSVDSGNDEWVDFSGKFMSTPDPACAAVDGEPTVGATGDQHLADYGRPQDEKVSGGRLQTIQTSEAADAAAVHTGQVSTYRYQLCVERAARANLEAAVATAAEAVAAQVSTVLALEVSAIEHRLAIIQAAHAHEHADLGVVNHVDLTTAQELQQTTGQATDLLQAQVFSLQQQLDKERTECALLAAAKEEAMPTSQLMQQMTGHVMECVKAKYPKAQQCLSKACGSAVPGYVFFASMDHLFDDISRVRGGKCDEWAILRQAGACNADPNCAGFNFDNYGSCRKSSAKPLGAMPVPEDKHHPCYGVYMKSQ